MIRKNILLLTTMLGVLAGVICFTTSGNYNVAFASIIETSDVTFAIPSTNGTTTSNVYYAVDGERVAHWSYSGFYIEYDCSGSYGDLGVANLVTYKSLRIIDFCKISISFPSTISSVLINTTTYSAFLSEKTEYSSNITSKEKIEGVGIVFTRNDSNPIVIKSPSSFSATVKGFTFVVGTLTTRAPIGGYVSDNGKKAIVAFGYNYTGLDISDGCFGVAVSEDGSTYTELKNGKYSSLLSKSGNFYVYKVDSAPKTYYAKGFVRFGSVGGETSTFSEATQVTGNLSGNEYLL